MRWNRALVAIASLSMIVGFGCSDDADNGGGGGNNATPARPDTGSSPDEDTTSGPSDTTSGGGDTTMDGGSSTSDGGADGMEMADGQSGSDDTSNGGGSLSPDDFQTVDCSSTDVATTVTVGPGFKYQPASATVAQGGVVQWEWPQNLGLSHNVVGGGECGAAQPDWFESQSTRASGTTFCVRFDAEPGTYGYQCTVGSHCSQGMKATIEVTE
jgi:plastocyanin